MDVVDAVGIPTVAVAVAAGDVKSGSDNMTCEKAETCFRLKTIQVAKVWMDSFEAPPSVKAFNFFSNLVAHDDEDDMILG